MNAGDRLGRNQILRSQDVRCDLVCAEKLLQESTSKLNALVASPLAHGTCRNNSTDKTQEVGLWFGKEHWE